MTNVWEETGLQGNIPCRVSILGLCFECKLIPKGKENGENGSYVCRSIPEESRMLKQDRFTGNQGGGNNDTTWSD